MGILTWTCLCPAYLCVCVNVRVLLFIRHSVVFVCVVQCDHVSQSLTDSVVCRVCVCMPAVCLLYFHVSHWLISMLVIAIATMRWHMPASWLSDWQDHRCGEIQRMLEQITPRPFTSSEGQSACPSCLPPLFRSFTASFSKRLTQNKTWRSPALQTQTDQDEVENMVWVMAGHTKESTNSIFHHFFQKLQVSVLLYVRSDFKTQVSTCYDPEVMLLCAKQGSDLLYLSNNSAVSIHLETCS